jgi:DNA adenine methylase
MYNKSILKWAGNKIRIMNTLQGYIETPNIFVEPFGGSFVVSLNTTAKEYRIGDINSDIIGLYNAVITDSNFIQTAQQYYVNGIDRDKYNKLRDEFNKTRSPYLFLYLNRHCFNGLTRYNKDGNFNVPFGDYDKVHFPEEEIKNFKNKFTSIPFKNTTFEDPSYYEGLGEGDVVYFDPPYFPASETANFTDYTKEGFSLEQQEHLADICNKLAKDGVKVIVSNHDVPIARKLYDGAMFHPISVARSISASGDSRKKAKEIIAVWNNNDNALFDF